MGSTSETVKVTPINSVLGVLNLLSKILDETSPGKDKTIRTETTPSIWKEINEENQEAVLVFPYQWMGRRFKSWQKIEKRLPGRNYAMYCNNRN